MFYHIFGQGEAAAIVMNQGAGFVVMIVLISFLAVNVVISAAGRCPAAAEGAREETN